MQKGTLILTFSQGEKELPRNYLTLGRRQAAPSLSLPLGEKDAAAPSEGKVWVVGEGW